MSHDRTQEIRQWLMKKERPAVVRVKSTDGEVRDVHVPDRPRWSDMAATINTLEPALLEALTTDGDVIRTVRYGKIVDVDQVDPVDPMPPGPLHDDPEAARTMHFANLIHRAYEFSTGLAFDKLSEMMERQLEQSSKVEERLQRMESAYQAEMHQRVQGEIEAARAQANGEEGGGDSIIKAFANGMSQAKEGAPRPTNGQSNHGGFSMPDEDN